MEEYIKEILELVNRAQILNHPKSYSLEKAGPDTIQLRFVHLTEEKISEQFVVSLERSTGIITYIYETKPKTNLLLGLSPSRGAHLLLEEWKTKKE